MGEGGRMLARLMQRPADRIGRALKRAFFPNSFLLHKGLADRDPEVPRYWRDRYSAPGILLLAAAVEGSYPFSVSGEGLAQAEAPSLHAMAASPAIAAIAARPALSEPGNGIFSSLHP